MSEKTASIRLVRVALAEIKPHPRNPRRHPDPGSRQWEILSKTTVFRAVTSRLHGIARPAVTRNHAKVICLPTSSGDAYVVEGSANLRSSDNVEQMLITNDGETHAFHAAWIDELAA